MGYTVDGIEQSFNLATNGTRVDVMRVSFITDDGDNGSVTVPLAPGWGEVADAAIKEQVAAYEALRGK